MLTMKGKQQHYNVLMNNTKSWSPYSSVSIERAFAEDAGGCMWPPRSYTCGFCRREFTSAQALGGHMNVHRRDRAMLSQSLNPNNNYNYFSGASRVSSSGAKVEELAYHNHDLSLGLSCKRPRLAASPSPSSSPPLKTCFGGVEVLGFRASSIEELDLELRLGHDRPVVK